MNGAKPTKSELKVELKKVIAENLVYYLWCFIWNTLCFISTIALDSYHIIGHRIASLVGSAAALGYFVFGTTIFLNILIISEISKGKLDRVLKCFRWEIVAALLMLQPRAYGVMKQLLKQVEAEEEEDSAV